MKNIFGSLRPLFCTEWHSVCSVVGCGLGAIVMKEFTDQPNAAVPLCCIHAKREIDFLEEEATK